MTEELNRILQVKSLRKNFGGVVALDDLSFEVHEGQIKSIIGPNGAGKTTLFNVISGIYPPTSGEVWFSGKRIANLPPHVAAKRGISRTFQNLQLFSNMSVLENVMVGKHVRTKSEFFSNSFLLRRAKIEEDLIARDAWEKLALVGLKERGLEPASAITFAEQRLLEIARALATDPKIILLDEPAAGLNITEIKMMAQLIQKIKSQGVTVLLVEHQMGLVMDISDEILACAPVR